MANAIIIAPDLNTGRAITAHSGEAGKELIDEQGFTAYLAKPVRKLAVLSALERYAAHVTA